MGKKDGRRKTAHYFNDPLLPQKLFRGNGKGEGKNSSSGIGKAEQDDCGGGGDTNEASGRVKQLGREMGLIKALAGKKKL